MVCKSKDVIQFPDWLGVTASADVIDQSVAWELMPYWFIMDILKRESPVLTGIKASG